MSERFEWMLEEAKKSFLTGYNSKILWGSRSIYRKDWIYIKQFINKFKIKTVIEYGVGLSTELLYLEGCKVYCLEDQDWWADHNRKVFKGIKEIEIISYKVGAIENTQRGFDLAFVDGPKDERTETVEHAKQHAEFIYCHDRRQRELIRGVDGWEEFNFHDLYKGYFFIKEAKQNE